MENNEKKFVLVLNGYGTSTYFNMCILQLLQDANGETENIRIAQGKYKFPESLKETFAQFKKEIAWKKLQ